MKSINIIIILTECYLLNNVILKGDCLADIDDEGDLVCVSPAGGGDDIVTIGTN